MSHDGSTVSEPSREVSRITSRRTRISTDRFDGDWPIERESRTNAAVNPVVAAAVHSPSQTAGCSNIVTPVPHYVPRLFDVEWLYGVAGVIMALLDPGDKRKRRSEVYVQSVHETIDMNDFLPTTYDDMAEWRTVIGKLSQPARS